MGMEKQVLDYTLVPTGLMIMVGYHIWLLYQVVKHPTRTVMGINAINRRFWVRAMMEVPPIPSIYFLTSHNFAIFAVSKEIFF